MPETRNESPEGSPRSRFGRFFSRKGTKKENESIDRKKTYENEASQTPDKINDVATPEVEENDINSKKKTEKDEHPESPDDEIPVKELQKQIENELDPKALTTLINNSIKEAVRNIVKDGVCDYIEKPPSISKKPKPKEKKKLPESPEELIPTKDCNKENKSLLNSEEKTFDSHTMDPARNRLSPRAPRAPRVPRAPSPSKSPGKTTISQCDRSICPAYAALDCERAKRSKHKKSKQKTNVSTDNRRMTGNVNIYICSEANENVKRKCPEKDKCSEDSSSESEMKSSTSGSSVSTSKLMDALTRKRKKRMESQELDCLCEEPEDITEGDKSTKRMSEAPDETSSFSRMNYSNEIESSEDYLDGCSLENCPAMSTNDFDYQESFYDNNNSWGTPRPSRNYSFLPAERDVPDNFKEGICCSCKPPKPQRPPCPCEPQEKVYSVATNYPEAHRLVRCDEPVNKPEEKSCCRIREEPEREIFTICTNEPEEEFTVCGRPDAEEEEKIGPVEGSRESLKNGTPTAEEAEETTDVNEANEFLEEDKPVATDDAVQKDESDTSRAPVPESIPSGEKKRESFLLRSWKRAMTIVKRSSSSAPGANDSDQSNLPQEPKKSDSSQIKINEAPPKVVPTSKPPPKPPSSLNRPQTVIKRRGKPKIVAKITTKQQEKRTSLSDSKLSNQITQKPEVVSSPQSIQKPEVVSSPQSIQKPEVALPHHESLQKPQKEDKPIIDCGCGKPEEPKIVPCTFIAAEEPQQEECCQSCNKKKTNCECCEKCCRQEELTCRCSEPPREQKCCMCQEETTCCTCRQPNPPKPCKISCGSCCNPMNCCTCRAPVRKCSYCRMPSDFCNCQSPYGKGRSIQDENNNSGVSGNWKPRPGIPPRFPRERFNRENPDNCRCDQLKPYGSEELPYQKLNVFSNVMTELQQKISDSVSCDQCNTTSCCCPKSPRCLSTIAERPSLQYRNESPPDCNCPRVNRKTLAVCDNCRTSPCRCRRDKRPQAKCFYCKTMPCRCNWRFKESREEFDDSTGMKKTRSCRCPSPKRMTNGQSTKEFMAPRHRPPKNWLD